MLMNQAFFLRMFHPSEAGRDVDMQREGSRGQAKRSFLSDVVSFLSRIFSMKLLCILQSVLQISAFQNNIIDKHSFF